MAEKRTIELEIQDNSKTLKQQYKEAVVELQKIVQLYGETSDEAIKAAKSAAELKDMIEDTNDLLATQKGEGTFIATGKAINAAASGLSAYEGALGLVGVESEALQETMLRVQSAMALSQGLEGLEDAGRAFKTLGATAKDTFKSLSSESSLAGKATSALGPIWKAVGLSGKTALSGIRAGIAATGIGLLVIALGTIVAYWDDIKAAVGGVSSEMEKNLELSHQQVENAQSEVELFDLQENSLKLQGKSEEEILKIRQGKLKVLAKEEEKEIALAEKKKKLEVDAAKRNKRLLEGYLTMQIEGIILPFRILGGMVDATMLTINAGLRALGQDEIKYKTINSYLTEFREYAAGGLSKMVFDPEGIAKESDAAIKSMKKGLEQTKNEIDGAELQIRDLKKGSAATQAKDQKDADMSMTEYLNALEAERQANITNAKEKELQELANKYDEMTALADKAGQDTTELTKKYQQDQIDITKKYNELEKQAQAEKDAELLQKMREADAAAYEIEKANRQLRIDTMQEGRAKELEIIDLAYDSELLALNNQLDAKAISEEEYQQQKLLMEEKYGKQIADTNKKFDDEDMARRQEKISQGLDLARGQFQALGDLAASFNFKSKAAAKAAFNVKKGADIAAATIDTYKAATGAYSSMSSIPVVGPALGAVAAAMAVTAGLLNVKKIASQKFEGGGVPSGGGGGGGEGALSGGMSGGSQAPSFNVVGNNGLNQLAQLQQQPTQAYVVSGQVTTAQSLDRNRIQNATL